ncbi:hypothetical protein L208DRAFT_891526 [Tricholoma matsutake]|nr:hypothetical protein L208DRAFT_891526 [Tricholoma matsutake 945]
MYYQVLRVSTEWTSCRMGSTAFSSYDPLQYTGMWKLCPEHNETHNYPVQVIHLDTILRSTHLFPCFGEGFLPGEMKQSDALDAWDKYLVNHFIDYHTHQLLS